MKKLNTVIFSLLRFLLGAAGALWLVGGLGGALKAGLDRAWGPTVTGLLGALVGYGAAYGAFVRFPWESRLEADPPAA
ncbi:hypothetical protein J421_5362 (plasmid) [Gemmatirosa kalamazoonensis]|uniref:Uncharacterized protein n=1 Tax=Gemmatirosa kalamazoonensis TaxID=861299 RepID=W0RR02_9BACT|nr:hypothetical protein [Gemmatirosa kalamazoonensis]AHG92897.1 hypothetical protein J421_5362 [Gemmatirosa kalamazoonensis]